MPAQSKGAVPARSRFEGTLQYEFLGDDDAVGVAAVGDAARVLVREVVSENEIGAELLEALLALGAGAIGVDQAAYGGQVTEL